MKKLIITTTFAFAVIAANAQFKVYPTGQVGVASTTTTTPSYSFQVTAGDAGVTAGNMDIHTATNGYKIGGNMFLWNNGNTTDAFAGVNAATTATSGSYNTGFGSGAGHSMTNGGKGVFVGYAAGYNNTASYATYVGNDAGAGNTTGIYNVAFGYASGYYNQTGTDNTNIGMFAGYSNTASYSTFVGSSAGYQTTTGGSNVFIGYHAGYTHTTGGGNICIGSLADVSTPTVTNCINIGYAGTVCPSNSIYMGNTSIVSCKTQVAWTLYSDRRIKNNIKQNVPGLAFIKLLQPVTYNLDIHKQNSIMGYPAKRDSSGNVIGIDTTFWQGKYDIEKTTFSGFIAQAVDSAAQKLGYEFSGVDKPKTQNDLYGLRYSEFVVPLVKSVQELSNIVDSLKSVITNCCSAKSNQRTMQSNDNSDSAQATAPNIHSLELANNTVLYQNFPNPFGDGTTIKYFIPDNISTAQIVFFDEFGNKLNEFKIQEKGMGQLNISSANLSSGTYSYSLIVNGNVVDTKKMLKTK